ncbi:MAG: lamin tail domain-containing protein, partial [Bacteroidales bacterium]|nr:lamin tail domain-containing protein [Bacteroidales bacterium]
MRYIRFLFIFLPLCSWAQLVDDFSDGDFSLAPAWSGMDSCFVVNGSLQLQSSGAMAEGAYLSLDLAVLDSLPSEWRFWIRENFSPSGNNYAEVWLLSDSADLRQASSGYFLRFGAAGSQDAIELYRKDPSGEQLICKGNDASIASSFKMAVRVNRDVAGHWTIRTDPDNSNNYVVEAEGDDDTYHGIGFFGFFIRYTSSNAKKFYFDDVYVGPEIVDLEPPALLELSIGGFNTLVLGFSESLDTTALEASHYRLDPAQVHPDTVCFGDRPSKVSLSFADSLPENENLQLNVVGIADLAGNVMPEGSWDFCLYDPAEYDIVINEIMADPSPVVGLPEWEYVELFNTTEFSIDMTGWILGIGNAERVFPSVRLDPYGYLILCKEEAEDELSSYGATCGFSSFSIANAGAMIRLFSPAEVMVSEVAFDDTWYHDADKKLGGWSIEQIDPYNPCAGTFNWSASSDHLGGTPGRENAINAPNAFNPQVERVSMMGDDLVLLWFDQQMDRASVADPSHYVV